MALANSKIACLLRRTTQISGGIALRLDGVIETTSVFVVQLKS
jgi:hypothetical protein